MSTFERIDIAIRLYSTSAETRLLSLPVNCILLYVHADAISLVFTSWHYGLHSKMSRYYMERCVELCASMVCINHSLNAICLASYIVHCLNALLEIGKRNSGTKKVSQGLCGWVHGMQLQDITYCR